MVLHLTGGEIAAGIGRGDGAVGDTQTDKGVPKGDIGSAATNIVPGQSRVALEAATADRSHIGGLIGLEDPVTVEIDPADQVGGAAINRGRTDGNRVGRGDIGQQGKTGDAVVVAVVARGAAAVVGAIHKAISVAARLGADIDALDHQMAGAAGGLQGAIGVRRIAIVAIRLGAQALGTEKGPGVVVGVAIVGDTDHHGNGDTRRDGGTAAQDPGKTVHLGGETGATVVQVIVVEKRCVIRGVYRIDTELLAIRCQRTVDAIDQDAHFVVEAPIDIFGVLLRTEHEVDDQRVIGRGDVESKLDRIVDTIAQVPVIGR